MLLGGAFAVPKDADEDRAISAVCAVNEWVAPQKLWSPRFARMVALRCYRLPARRRLYVSKVDARHVSMRCGSAIAGASS